ncbi:hypothetical protein PHLCEN_2v821 [Hermanssonia centrifuga]|uniref:Uncharacterized protein n=1 Tax=Hermanssonia centrifuga TaxID=98765 RepID=A0A2R6S4X3_9APHY|nr:hypothetical protein PHLCEN_2v821 [Hermanssonia centrifuga]
MPGRRTLFRPCIDLHDGKVKQIVGGTLSDDTDALKTNFVANHPPRYYAELYRDNNLEGGHVIMLGKGNTDAAREALAAWPGTLLAISWVLGCLNSFALTSKFVGRLQVGGGITDENCAEWIAAGASKVIVTSHLFPDAKFSLEKLARISDIVGKDKLVVDVSEFLVHAADVEGLCKGIDEQLVRNLGTWVTIPTTYAGGAKCK